MTTPRAALSGALPKEAEGPVRVQIRDDYLELETLSAAETATLRSWIGRINGATNVQPYLAEEGPGRFRLYVGPAAERARTTKGVQ